MAGVGTLDRDAIHERYRSEREKRLRPDGANQYIEPSGRFEHLADDPIADPAREILFTSNVLLTVPDAATDIESLPYPEDLRTAIRAAAAEPQRYWFDHPIQIGVEPAANELLYGLRGLDAAIEHIHAFSSGHTAAIVTADEDTAAAFLLRPQPEPAEAETYTTLSSRRGTVTNARFTGTDAATGNDATTLLADIAAAPPR